jgi:hypothetical protein
MSLDDFPRRRMWRLSHGQPSPEFGLSAFQEVDAAAAGLSGRLMD